MTSNKMVESYLVQLENTIRKYQDYGDGGRTSIDMFRKMMCQLTECEKHECLEQLGHAIHRREKTWDYAIEIVAEEGCCQALARSEHQALSGFHDKWADTVVLALMRTKCVTDVPAVLHYVERSIRKSEFPEGLVAASVLLDRLQGVEIGVMFLLDVDIELLSNYGVVTAFVHFYHQEGSDLLSNLITGLHDVSPNRAAIFREAIAEVLQKSWMKSRYGEEFIANAIPKF